MMEDTVVCSPVSEIKRLKKRVEELEARLPNPFRHARYVNIYVNGCGNRLYTSRAEAINAARTYGYINYGPHLKTIRIEFDG